jgi:hypothetical protein
MLPDADLPTRCHRDGTVTFWNVYTQQWERLCAMDISDDTLATLPHEERERIIRLAQRQEGIYGA